MGAYWRNYGIGKSPAQPHTTLCIQFLDRENNDKNNTLPLGKHIFLTIVIAFNNYLQEWHAEFIQTLQVMA